jgi:hypothetical protein
MRIGPRFDKKCVPLTIDGKPMHYVEITKYLGVMVPAGRKWKIDISCVRASFYRAFNPIFSRSKSADSELTSLYLLRTVCIPIVTYALEAGSHSNSLLSALDGLIDNALRKIFDVRDADCVGYLRTMFYIAPTKQLFLIARCKLLIAFFRRSSYVCRCIRELAFVECSSSLIENGIELSLPHLEQIQCLLNRYSQLA